MSAQAQPKTQMLQTESLDCGDSWRKKLEGKPTLLPIEDAIAIAASLVRAIRRCERVSLSNSVGRRLSDDVTARLDLPPFDQSAMDGYALAGTAESQTYFHSRRQSTRAGEAPGKLSPGYAIRIATGARIPSGADRVVLQEHADPRHDRVVLRDSGIQAGANIRYRGEDVRQGDIVLSRGDRIDARRVALAAAQGITSIDVISKPRVAVISSGNELRQPGEQLGSADVFDSNRPMLMVLAACAGAEVIDAGWCPDDPRVLSQLVSSLSEKNDLIIVSGGSSLGEGDGTAVALRAAGAHVSELKIAMKPGKPALVGKLGQANILGVPGNPFAAFVSWFTLGRAMMAAMFSLEHEMPKGREVYVLNELRRRSGRTEFAPARLVRTERGDVLEFLGRGGSGQLLPLSRADGLAWIEAARGSVLGGERVSFIPFDDGQIL